MNICQNLAIGEGLIRICLFENSIGISGRPAESDGKDSLMAGSFSTADLSLVQNQRTGKRTLRKIIRTWIFLQRTGL